MGSWGAAGDWGGLHLLHRRPRDRREWTDDGVRHEHRRLRGRGEKGEQVALCLGLRRGELLGPRRRDLAFVPRRVGGGEGR